jgi:hypothetical protein
VERGEVGLAAVIHPVEQQATRLLVGVRVEAIDRLAQPLAQHVGVPYRPEQAAEPAQLLDQRRHGLLVEERPERAQVAPEASGRHAGLVHALLTGIQTDDGVVQQEAPDGRRDGVLERGPGRGLLVHGRDIGVGRCQRSRAEGTSQLRHVVRLARAGRPEDVDHRVDHVRRGTGRGLDLDLPEPPADLVAVERRHEVVAELAERPVGLIPDGDHGAVGLEVCHLSQVGAPQGPPHRGREVIRRLPRRPVDFDLQPVEGDTLGRHRHLQRPPPVRTALAGPVAERDPHAEQPQVRRVEEAGVEQLLLGLRGDHPGHGLVQVGQPEPRPHRHLRLPLVRDPVGHGRTTRRLRWRAISYR